jgi:hypothetical protein
MEFPVVKPAMPMGEGTVDRGELNVVNEPTAFAIGIDVIN